MRLEQKYGHTPTAKKTYKVLRPIPQMMVDHTPEPLQQQYMAEFRDLMLQGLEVWLCQHSEPTQPPMTKYCLYMDVNFRSVIIGDGKANAHTSIIIAVRDI